MTAWTADRVATPSGPVVRIVAQDGEETVLTPPQAEQHASAVESLALRFYPDGDPTRALLLERVEQTREAAASRDVCAFGECTSEAVADGFCGPHQLAEVS